MYYILHSVFILKSKNINLYFFDILNVTNNFVCYFIIIHFRIVKNKHYILIFKKNIRRYFIIYNIVSF